LTPDVEMICGRPATSAREGVDITRERFEQNNQRLGKELWLWIFNSAENEPS
jgi:hypothetical protein